MNIFNRRQKYPITAAQQQERMAASVSALAYIVVAVLVAITGAHAIMLVLSEAASFTLAGQIGLVLMLFTVLRVGFPLVVELAAVISTVGAIRGLWRGDQKSWAGRIDIVWLVFAAANMITFFAVERGQALQGWQMNWLQYGLPLSGIIAGVMVIRLLLADPDHQRAEEESAAIEEHAANEFNARSDVERSEPMKLIQRRRAWRDYINELSAKGYNDEEIEFIIGFVPELRDMPKAGSPPPSRPSIRERVRARLENPLPDDVGQNTHDTARYEALPVPSTNGHEPGQGDGRPANFQ